MCINTGIHIRLLFFYLLFLYQHNITNYASPLPTQKSFRYRFADSQIFRAHGLIVFFGTPPCFGSILEQNLAKTMEGPQKTKVLVPKHWRVSKKPNNQSFRALGSWAARDSKTLVVLVCFRPVCVLAPKLWIFWDLSVSWEHFGAKPCQNHGGSPKKPKFWCQNIGGFQKNQTTKVSGRWVAGQLETPKL